MVPILLPLLFAAAPATAVRPEALRAHMGFLASDLLEGRRTGTRGYDLAAAYVAARFEAAGIAPGASGSYYQQVPFREGIVDPAGTEMSVRQDRGERLRMPERRGQLLNCRGAPRFPGARTFSYDSDLLGPPHIHGSSPLGPMMRGTLAPDARR